ncbi:hypothetical protein H4219_005477 [Mycoemilia scoparia]|uniref:Aquaporin n=1 Tax=Mycoemilia scoparia TaxID=417184 RepID=A0A9W7ZMT9_9FUNG|nr:hypothetical protein H4219_005477 [Mycoemilia scoparia]
MVFGSRSCAPYTAEFIGTFLFCLIGLGTNAQLTVTNSSEATGGGALLKALGWGFGLTLGTFVSKQVSGGHVNPVITVTAATHQGLGARRLFGHILAQLIGAFVASFFVWVNYGSLFGGISAGPDQGLDAGAAIFATYPASNVGFWHGAFTELLGTFVLSMGIHSISDRAANPNVEVISPIAIGLLFSGIGLGIGYPTGYALNPARDFGPRLFSAFLYGGKVFTVHNWYWLAPLISPFIGGSLGAGFYHKLVRAGSDEGDAHHQLPVSSEGGD